MTGSQRGAERRKRMERARALIAIECALSTLEDPDASPHVFTAGEWCRVPLNETREITGWDLEEWSTQWDEVPPMC